MTEREQRHHGLEPFVASRSKRDAGDAGIAIEIRSGLGHINLRGKVSDDGFRRAVEETLSQPLPSEPNTVTSGANTVCWLGPDEWLILTGIDNAAELVDELRDSTAGRHASVNDISGGQIAMRISGTNIRSVFAKGCTLDFHPRVFTSGMCAQSGLAKASVLFILADDSDCFDVVVRRSFSDYLVRWLDHAAAEFGVTFRG